MVLWSILITASIITTFVITYHYDIPSNPAAGWPDSNAKSRPGDTALIYAKPYCRAPPYLIGMLAGYLYWSWGSEKGRLRASTLTVLSGWVVSLFLISFTVYGMVGGGGRYVSHDMDKFENALWGAFARVLWSIMLVWVTMACTYGYGGIVDSFLASPLWMPLSKLSFCAYLVHPLVLNTYYASQPQPLYYSDNNFIYIYIGNVFFTYAVAALVSLMIEFPFAAITKKHLGA